MVPEVARSLVEALSGEGLGLRSALGVDRQGELRRRDRNARPEEGGLNIEGLAARRDAGTLVIGLRSPLSGGAAILLRFTNPAEVVDRLDAVPLISLLEGGRLNLGGRGVRSMEYVENAPADRRYLIVAGPVGSDSEFTLFHWSGDANQRPAEVSGAAALLRRFADESDVRWGERFRFGPEAMVVEPSGQRLLLLSDDGDRIVDRAKCQDDGTPAERRSFRGVFLRLQ